MKRQNQDSYSFSFPRITWLNKLRTSGPSLVPSVGGGQVTAPSPHLHRIPSRTDRLRFETGVPLQPPEPGSGGSQGPAVPQAHLARRRKSQLASTPGFPVPAQNRSSGLSASQSASPGRRKDSNAWALPQFKDVSGARRAPGYSRMEACSYRGMSSGQRAATSFPISQRESR
jgi:hypothetical protein